MAGVRALPGALLVSCLALALTAAPAGAQSTAGAAPGEAATETPGEAAGETLGPVTKLPLPRYVSLRSDKVNVRRGPGLDYPIDWVFQRAGLPVRIIDEYGHWRRIVDSDDAGGWVYHALLNSRRTALVTGDETGGETGAEAVLRAEPADDAPATARAEPGVVATLRRCRPDWCEVEAKGISGWVPKAAIWGVGPEETFGG